MALSTETLDVLYMRNGLGKFHRPADSWQCEYDHCIHDFARAIEAEVRKQDDALILQLVEALCECAEDSQEQLDRMEAARLRDYKPNAIAWQEGTIAKAKAAITAGRARLEVFDNATRRTKSEP